MTARVILERRLANGRWLRVGDGVTADDPPGSVSVELTSGQRDVLVFGWMGQHGPGVWRSLSGADIATGDTREIHSDGFGELADLTKKSTYGFTWTEGKWGLTIRCRLRLQST